MPVVFTNVTIVSAPLLLGNKLYNWKEVQNTGCKSTNPISLHEIVTDDKTSTHMLTFYMTERQESAVVRFSLQASPADALWPHLHYNPQTLGRKKAHGFDILRSVSRLIYKWKSI